MRLSLRWRMLLGSFLVIAITLLVIIPLMTSRARDRAARDLDERVTIQAEALTSLAAGSFTDLSERTSLSEDATNVLLNGDRAALFRADGSLVFASDTATRPSFEAPEIQRALTGTTARAVRASPLTGVSELHVALPVVESGRVVGVTRVTASRASLGEASADVLKVLFIAGASVFAVTVILSLAFTASLIRTLASLTAVARSLAGGNLHDRAEATGIEEARPLAAAINDMASGLQEQVANSYRERDTFGAVIDSMADALLVVDQQGEVALANPAAIALFTPNNRDIIGKRFIQVVWDHELAHLVERVSRLERRQTIAIQYGADLAQLQVSAAPVRLREGRAVLLLCQDTSESQRLNDLRRDFVANVSHEIRTPLASIKASVETLLGAAQGDPSATQEFLQRINIEVDHMTQLSERLLDLSRIETGRAAFAAQPLRLEPLLAEAVARIRPRADSQGVDISIQTPPALPPVMADGEAVHRILQSLLENAVKFTPPKGHVLVEAALNDRLVQVTVRDTGPGIPPEDLPRIFERFYKVDRSRSSTGVGLGLALAKHAVQSQGGTIWAESGSGLGAAIHFTLVIADPA